MEPKTERMLRTYLGYRMAGPAGCALAFIGFLTFFLVIGLLGVAKSCERHLEGGASVPHFEGLSRAKGGVKR